MIEQADKQPGWQTKLRLPERAAWIQTLDRIEGKLDTLTVAVNLLLKALAEDDPEAPNMGLDKGEAPKGRDAL